MVPASLICLAIASLAATCAADAGHEEDYYYDDTDYYYYDDDEYYYYDDDVSCGPTPDIKDGYAEDTNATAVAGEIRLVTCNAGFTLSSGDNYIMCDRNGDWLVDNTSCEEDIGSLRCGNPPFVPFGFFESGLYKVGAQRSLVCLPGYSNSNGTGYATCTRNLTWTDAGSCGRDCTGTPSVKNGIVLPGSSSINSKRSFSCANGYYATGDNTLECPPSGFWKANGQCERRPFTILCHETPFIPNGVIEEGESTEGSVRLVTCSPDYEMSFGESFIECQANGLWTVPGICLSVSSTMPSTSTSTSTSTKPSGATGPETTPETTRRTRRVTTTETTRSRIETTTNTTWTSGASRRTRPIRTTETTQSLPETTTKTTRKVQPTTTEATRSRPETTTETSRRTRPVRTTESTQSLPETTTKTTHKVQPTTTEATRSRPETTTETTRRTRPGRSTQSLPETTTKTTRKFRPTTTETTRSPLEITTKARGFRPNTTRETTRRTRPARTTETTTKSTGRTRLATTLLPTSTGSAGHYSIHGSFRVQRRLEPTCCNVLKAKRNAPELIEAAKVGDFYSAVKLLQSEDADPNSRDENGWTPLMWAAARETNNQIAIMYRLIICCTDVNARNTDGSTSLIFAAKASRLAPARLLLRRRADVNLANKYGSTPLLVAARRGSTSLVELFLQFRANVSAVDTFGDTALSWATLGNHTDTVELLLDAGSDVNWRNKRGNTPLMLAAISGYYEVAQKLLARGASTSMTNGEDHTALTMAIANGRTRVVNLLAAQRMAAMTYAGDGVDLTRALASVAHRSSQSYDDK